LQEVVFDSSFLLAIVQHPTTWYEDLVERIGAFQPIILGCVYDELERIANSNTRRGRFAGLAKDIAGDFKKVNCKRDSPDDEIISYSSANRARIATIDGDLISRVKALRMQLVTLRHGRVYVA
jgi:rRNA-processing protein FCF1